MATTSFDLDLEQAFLASVLPAGFRVVNKVTSEEFFGNVHMELESPGFLLEVMKDRGDIILNVAPHCRSTNWLLLDNVLLAIAPDTDVPSAAASRLNLKAYAALVLKHQEALTRALSAAEFARTSRLARQVGLRRWGLEETDLE